MGSSPKAVALKSATKLKATWLILDRKMKNDEDYFLKKLSCGISRIRSSDRIVRIRGPIDTPQQKRSYKSSETYGDSLPPYDFSIDSQFFTIDNFSNSRVNYGVHHDDQGQRQKKPYEENIHNEQKRVIKQKQEFQENDKKIQECESERYLYSGGARHFFLRGAEKYTISEHFFKFE